MFKNARGNYLSFKAVAKWIYLGGQDPSDPFSMGWSLATKLGKATGLINNGSCCFVHNVIKIQNF